MKVLVVDVCGTHGGLGNGVGAITIIMLSEAQPPVVVLEPLVAGSEHPLVSRSLGGLTAHHDGVHMGRSSAHQAPTRLRELR